MNQHRPAQAPTYEVDFYAWTQHQAKLLRALERLPGLPGELDLERVAEEVQDLGGAELNQVKSFIRQILAHLIKAASEPSSQAVHHWKVEVANFHAELLDRYTPSMRQLIDMQEIWRRAVKLAEVSLREFDSELAPGLPAVCPFPFDDFVQEDLDFDALQSRLTDTAQGGTPAD